MVHALEQTRRLLKRDGDLIDIQPRIGAPLIKVFQSGSVAFVEPDPSYDYEEDLRQADAALTHVIQRGLFVMEESREFDFLTHGSSAQELLAFWGKTSTNDNISKEDPAEWRVKEVYDRAERIRKTAGQGAEVVLHERARIIRLSPNLGKEELT